MIQTGEYQIFCTSINVSSGANVSTSANNISKTYLLQLKKPNQSLLLSLVKSGILLGATITDNYQSISFRANSVRRITNELNEPNEPNEPNGLNKYELCINYLYYLSKQFEYLIKKEKKCFYTLKKENIIIIDDFKSIYISIGDLLDIEEDYLTIYTPFEKTNYNSPELNAVTCIPAKINYKTIYYSLALFILFFTNEKENNKLQGTKLFYTLERCLEMNPEKRSILFI